MLLALLLAVAPQAETAVDTERAFAAAAQRDGQWKAFRAFAGEDALVFTPQPAKAMEALPTKEPAIAVQWWPADSFVSCDGQMAVNTGPWVRPDSFGYFTTVWRRNAEGRFKWIVDAGDETAAPRALPERPRVRHASCRGKPSRIEFEPCPGDKLKCGEGMSPDRTLVWDWTVQSDGARTFTARIWNGHDFDQVVHDVAAAAPRK